MDPIQEVNTHILAHQQAISEVQKRIGRIEDMVQGIPQEIQFIKATVDKIGLNMDKILDKLETRYVAKDIYDATLSAMNCQIASAKVEADKKIDSLEANISWVTKGAIVMLIYLAKDLIGLLITK